MIQLHHLKASRATRVLWLLEELELPYELVLYDRDPKTLLAPPALAEIHPLGKSPVIVDGNRTIAESGAILEYLIDTYGKGRFAPAPGTPAHDHYRYFMHYAEGSLMPILLVALIARRVKAGAPFLVKPIAKAIAGKIGSGYVEPNLSRHVAFLEAHLAKHAWFAGDELTAADMQMSYPVEACVDRAKQFLPAGSKLVALLEKIRARPAYQRAIAKGGPVIPD